MRRLRQPLSGGEKGQKIKPPPLMPPTCVAQAVCVGERGRRLIAIHIAVEAQRWRSTGVIALAVCGKTSLRLASTSTEIK